MAGKHMKIRKIVVPFMTLVIMTSQLAGCATITGDEMQGSWQESPDGSIEYAAPDAGQQAAADTQDNLGVGADDSNEDQITELTHEELIGIFELAYDSKNALAGEIPVDALIKQELHIMPYLVTPDKQLPEDYEDQYRAWRPAETQEPEQQQDQTQQSNQTSKPNSEGQQQSSKPNADNNSTSGPREVDDGTDPSLISSGTEGDNHITQEELTKGIDPNQNPWDVQGELFYGGG